MKSVTEAIDDLVRLGLSQADISRAIGLHHSQTSRWAAGKAPRHAVAIRKLYELHGQATAAVGVPRLLRARKGAK